MPVNLAGGGINFAGYAVAVPFLASATDRMDGRRLYIGSALPGAAASLVFAVFAHGFAFALTLRFVGGVGLAGVHMPGLNLQMDWVDRSHQGRAAGIYTSSYAGGSAVSFMIAGIVDTAFGWRATFLSQLVWARCCRSARAPCSRGHRSRRRLIDRGRLTGLSFAIAL